DRWRGCDERVRQALDLMSCRGGFIENIDIPFGRFRLPPNEIPEVLPQQLLMLQIAAEAMGDADLPLRERRERAGVIIGAEFDYEATNFHLRWHTLAQPENERERAWLDDEVCPALNATRTVGALGNIIASRIARELSFGGASFALSGGELSGLHALRIAIDALRCGETDLMIVGAVDLACDARAMLLSHSQRLPGDGACALVLKRLDDAERDGDRIYALVQGVGFDGGAKAGPAAMQRAYDEAGVSPESFDYIETAVTGDATEDRTQVGALNEYFSDHQGMTALGASAPAIGCVGAAAGLASVAKASLCLYHRIIPPFGGIESPPKEKHVNSERFCVPRSASHWLRDRDDGPRRAGVSAQSCDGRFGHVVLEESSVSSSPRIEIERRQPLGAREFGLFALAGDGTQELLAQIAALRDYVERFDAPIETLARGWHKQNPVNAAARLAMSFVADNSRSLRAAISRAERALQSDPQTAIQDSSLFYNPAPLGRGARVAFVFPGSGNHFIGMGREIGVEWPEVLRAIDAETGRLAGQLMGQSAAASDYDDMRTAIFGQVSFGTVLSDLLRQLGVEPTAAIGYSLGESTAMFAMRAWRDRDEMFRRMHQSPLFRTDLAGPYDAVRRAWSIPPSQTIEWRAVVLNRPAVEVREALRATNTPHVRLLIVNTPGESVIGGLPGDVERVVAALGCNAVSLEGVASVHCDVLNAVEDSYRALHLLPVTPPDGIDFYSGHAASRYELTRESAAESILNQALHGFDFPALIRQAHDDGVRAFVEIGPQSSCTRMISEILAGRPHLAASASSRDQSEVLSVLRLLATLIAERIPVDLDALYGVETRAVAHQVESKEESADRRTIRVPVGGPSLLSKPRPRQSEVERRAAPVGISSAIAETASATAQAHDAFLQFSQRVGTELATVVKYQRSLAESIQQSGGTLPPLPPLVTARPAVRGLGDVAFTREQCFEFARGRIGNVLGAEFAEIDAHPTRVRLPDEPLMLVDRIISVEGVPRSLTHGKLITEHDVFANAWYLDGGRAPVCISVEAGQADL
ncbi:MAG: type I polyketide synthase, partial [Planctomycetes bacterium]|nr:type I polyketide synthase [Planctomycetota bacterium]